MDNYSLRYADSDGTGERTVTFYAHSTGNALELAKEAAGGDWAVLSRNGQQICRMRMMGTSGVWFVEGHPQTEPPCANEGAAPPPPPGTR